MDWLELGKKAWSLITTPFFELNGNQVSIVSIFASLIIFLVAIYCSKYIEKIIGNAIKGRIQDHGVRGSIERFSRYLILVLGALISLDSLGISLGSLAAVGGILMVGVGFGLQNITQNFIAGLIILIERPIKRGDIVKIGETSGRVIDINARSTLVQTRDDVSIIVPNAQFISEQVLNESFSESKIRCHVRVGVSYGSDVEKVKEVLLDIAKNSPKVTQNPGPVVIFEDFGDSSLNFDLRVWVRDLWDMDLTLSEIRFEVVSAFRKNQIEIPFPQRDVHVKEHPATIS